MAQTTVVVIFYSRGGETERLAHAAAVGAVQERAAIRLRRMADRDADSTLERYPEAREALRRMHNEYVAPREADVLAADALIVGSPPDVDASAAEWSPLLELLAAMQADGRLAGKMAAVVQSGRGAESLAAAIRRAGMSVIALDGSSPAADAVSRAVALGRQVASAARAAKLT